MKKKYTKKRYTKKRYTKKKSLIKYKGIQIGGNNLDILRKHNPDSFINQNEINQMYQLLYDIHYFLKKYNIKYCSFAGTLIGLIRNKGLLYWDDDIDIVIHQNDLDKLKNLESVLNKNSYGITPFWGGVKIFNTKNKMISHYPGHSFKFSWPFIDVFTYYEKDNIIYFKNHFHKPKCIFDKSDFYPFKLYKFGNYKIYGPNNPTNFLNSCYGSDWNKKIKVYEYNHRKESYNKVSMKEIDIDKSLLTCPKNNIKLYTNFIK